MGWEIVSVLVLTGLGAVGLFFSLSRLERWLLHDTAKQQAVILLPLGSDEDHALWQLHRATATAKSADLAEETILVVVDCGMTEQSRLAAQLLTRENTWMHLVEQNRLSGLLGDLLRP